MSSNAYGTDLARRIREWDDYVEDHDREQATKPFDAGIMLALATFFAAWDDPDIGLAKAVEGLRATVEVVIVTAPSDESLDTLIESLTQND